MIFEGIKISVEIFHHRQVSKLLMAVAIFGNDPKHAVKINSSSHKKYKPPRAIIYDEITLQVIFYVQSSVAWIWVLLCSWKNVMAIIKEYGLNNALNVPCSVFRSISCWFPVSEQFPGGFKFLALSRYHFFGQGEKWRRKMVLITRAIMNAQLQLKSLAWNKTLWLHQSMVRFMCCKGSWLSTGCSIMTYFTVL